MRIISGEVDELDFLIRQFPLCVVDPAIIFYLNLSFSLSIRFNKYVVFMDRLAVFPFHLSTLSIN